MMIPNSFLGRVDQYHNLITSLIFTHHPRFKYIKAFNLRRGFGLEQWFWEISSIRVSPNWNGL